MLDLGLGVMMFNATFNTISVISWCHVKLIMIKKVNHIGF
jgi:hypothetical protein